MHFRAPAVHCRLRTWEKYQRSSSWLRSLVAAIALARSVVATDSAVLFYDGTGLNATSGLQRVIHLPELVSSFADPDTFVGWGYPNIWPNAGGGYRMVYNGDWKHQHYPRLVLLAWRT